MRRNASRPGAWLFYIGRMDGLLTYAVPLAALATFCVLCVGLFGLFRGGAFNRTYSNKLMRLRVLLQFVTVVLAMTALYFAKG